MSLKIQIILIFMTVFFFLFVLYGMKKAKLTADLAVVWTLFSATLIVISLFPAIVDTVSEVLGIRTVTNAIFMGMIFILLCMVFYLCLKVSVLEERLKNVIQKYSIDKSKDDKS